MILAVLKKNFKPNSMNFIILIKINIKMNLNNNIKISNLN